MAFSDLFLFLVSRANSRTVKCLLENTFCALLLPQFLEYGNFYLT